MKIKVSIIIPVYNAEKYLRQCLDSALSQTLCDIEIICVNDGSTDTSSTILNEYAKKDKKIKILTQENQGLAGARNTGIRAAVGQYIGFLDSDDFIEPNYYETLYQAAIAQNADLARTTYSHYYSDEIIKPAAINEILESKAIKKEDLGINDHLVVVWNAIYRRDFLLKHGIFFDITHIINEDILFTAKVTFLSQKSVSVTGTMLYYRRIMVYADMEKPLSMQINNLQLFQRIQQETINFINKFKMLCEQDYIEAYKKILWRYHDRFNKITLYRSKKELKQLFQAWVTVFDSFEYSNDPELEFKSYYGFLKENDFEGYLNFLKNPQIIISLTSYPPRISTVYKAIETLLNQKKKADKVILWLAKTQFTNKEADLPINLLCLVDYGLTIEWLDNDIKSYKKLVPALKKYPDSLIITADDDNLYQRDWVENLYNAYKNNPELIHGSRVRKIALDENSTPLSYNKWVVYREQTITPPAFSNFITGVGGAVWHSKLLHTDVFREDLFMKLAPRADDIWFWAMAILNNKKINLVTDMNFKMNLINGSQETRLWQTNIYENDPQFMAVLNYYPNILEKLWQENAVKIENRITHTKLLVDKTAMLQHIPKNNVTCEVRGIGNCYGNISQQIMAICQPKKHYVILGSFDPLSRYDDKAINRISENLAADDIASGRIEIIQASYLAGLARLANQSVDFLYLNIDTNFESVVYALSIAALKVKSGGFIGGNNYKHQGRYDFAQNKFIKYGVIEAVQKFMVNAMYDLIYLTNEPDGFWSYVLKKAN